MTSLNSQRAIALDTVSGRQGSPVGRLAVPGAMAITPDGRTVYVLDRDATVLVTSTNAAGTTAPATTR